MKLIILVFNQKDECFKKVFILRIPIRKLNALQNPSKQLDPQRKVFITVVLLKVLSMILMVPLKIFQGLSHLIPNFTKLIITVEQLS